MHKQEHPAGAGTPDRASEFVLDGQPDNTISTPSNSTLAAMLLARRYGLAMPTAETIAALAGLAVST